MNVRELIEALEKLDGDTIVLRGDWNSRYGEWDYLSSPDFYDPQIIFVESVNYIGGYRDVTDRERDQDIQAIVI